MTTGASGPPAASWLARRSTSKARPGLDRPARSAPGAKPTADMADDRLEADPRRLPGEVVEVGLVVDEQDDRPIRVHHPAEPCPERRAGRDRQRARDALVGVGLGRPRVDHERAVAQRRVELVAGERLDGRHRRAEQPRPGLVHRPHPGEVARDRGLSGEERPGEGLDLERAEQRVVAPLVADRRPRGRGDPGRAQRSRAVGRVDHDRVLVPEQDVVERAIHRRGVLAGVLRAEQVGPTHRADEQATRRSAAGTARRHGSGRRPRS